MPRHVLHLVGSPMSDFFRELSEMYAADCIAALDDPLRYIFTIAHVTPDGRWRFPSSLAPDAIAAAETLSVSQAIAHIAAMPIDVALPQMFCRAGMTHYRALLDMLRIPYLGNPPLQMAVAADKAKAKAIVAAAGVRVPRAELLRRGDAPSLAPKVVVKPNDSDNSDGVTLVTTSGGYPAALAAAFEFADEVLVEDYIELGREVRCGVVVDGSELVCLPIEEYRVDPASRPIRTRSDKLRRGDDDKLILASRVSAQSWIVAADDHVVARVWHAARLCHAALGCRHYSLFDFRIDPDGEVWFLEAGLYCSFAPQSVVVKMMAAHGIPLEQFFAGAVEQALAAHALPGSGGH